jgi:hypothetical protein
MQHHQESTTTTTCSTNTKKSVRFAPTAMMRLALHIDNYTDDEIDASFYSDAEYVAFKQDTRRTIRMVEMKQKIDEITVSRRGVESLTRDAVKLKSKHRRHARRVVMTEQELQQSYDSVSESGCGEEESQQQEVDKKIAAACIAVTRESAIMAYLTGLSDEAVVFELLFHASKNDNVDGERSRATSCPARVKRMVSTEPNLRIQHRRMSNYAA